MWLDQYEGLARQAGQAQLEVQNSGVAVLALQPSVRPTHPAFARFSFLFQQFYIDRSK